MADAGGHGSPPGSRGNPRRALLTPASTSAGTALTSASTAATNADPSTGSGRSGTSAPNLLRSPASIAGAPVFGGVTAEPSASPAEGMSETAGGHGSPPGTRGSPRRGVRGVDAIYFLCASSALMSCGTTVNRSPTIPKSAMSKIGASGFLSIATIVRAVCMPARCWMAPEIPSAT